MLNVTIIPAVAFFVNISCETALNSASIKSYKMPILCWDGITGMKFKFFSKKIALLSITTDTSWSAEDNSTSRRFFWGLSSFFCILKFGMIGQN